MLNLGLIIGLIGVFVGMALPLTGLAVFCVGLVTMILSGRR